ncbi:MAG TPA: MFS transporter [Propionibacteriaceae bacterium]|nr:MFS transporter [Propionibacteriaceae bacterium]
MERSKHVAAGLGAYRQILGDPRARAFSAAGLIARLPISMTGLGIVLLISLTSGSFGRAGLVAAVGTLAGAVAAPLWGQTIDRLGQARVLTIAAIVNSAGLALLVISVQLGWPLAVTLFAALGVGAGFSSAGSAVRARWSHRLRESPLLQTAFALEAVLDEVVFIVGPVLVTFLATAIHPALGVSVSAVIGLVGALLLAAQRSTQPPPVPRDRTRRPQRLPLAVLLPISVASLALGAVFGGMEVVVVAFAEEAGVLPYAGLFITAWSFGSLLAGVATGAIAWRAAAATRFRIGAAALAASLVPLLFLGSPLPVGALLLLSGMAIAPTLIATVAVIESSVPTARLTEALNWNTTGMAIGLAAGAAVTGHLIDLSGSRGGFFAVVGAGVLLVASALTVRARAVVSPEPESRDSAPVPALPPPAESPRR